jgi:hypothetical protein
MGLSPSIDLSDGQQKNMLQKMSIEFKGSNK